MLPSISPRASCYEGLTESGNSRETGIPLIFSSRQKLLFFNVISPIAKQFYFLSFVHDSFTLDCSSDVYNVLINL